MPHVYVTSHTTIDNMTVVKADIELTNVSSINSCKEIEFIDWRDVPHVEEVEEGFLERFPKLSCLTIGKSVKRIGVTPECRELMRKNDLLVQGKFGGYAEEFARENRLPFMPVDLQIASVGEYDARGIDTITLQFRLGVDYVTVHQDNCCPGISAGNNGGGSIDYQVPWNFFKEEDAQQKIAQKSWGTCREQILNNQEFADFIANARRVYSQYNHRKLMVVF